MKKQRLTCGDAEVRLVGGDVMDTVVLARKDDVAVLQEHHPTRKAEVRVRPLVNLVGKGHEDGQRIHVAVPRVYVVNVRCGYKKDREDSCLSPVEYCQQTNVSFVGRNTHRGTV